jgi:tRNA-Thr(GGU) m(6)t(6)A37 methyltransferase TsaA
MPVDEVKDAAGDACAYRPIGVIHSPFHDTVDVPIQPAAAEGVRGTIEIRPELAAGLRDLEGFSHVILLYHFHRITRTRLVVTPFLDNQPRGVFSTRAPSRPNPIGLSVVRLLGVEGNLLQIENVDVVDGTPLLDIKPYVPEFDHQPAERVGWLAAARGQVKDKRSDGRFH